MNIYRNRSLDTPFILPVQQPCRPLMGEDGTIGEWWFNEGTGTNLDDKAASPHDITISGATWTLNGPWGSALSFDGVNDYGTYKAALLHELTNFTIEAVVRSSVSTLNGQDPIYVESYNTGSTGSVCLRFGRANNALFLGWLDTAASAWLDVNSIVPIAWTEWNYVAGTSANLARVLYVNGLPCGSDTAATACYDGTYGPNGTLIGRNDQGGYSKMEIAYLRISNVARSAGEIMANAKLMGFA